jgi:hypothetical protein
MKVELTVLIVLIGVLTIGGKTLSSPGHNQGQNSNPGEDRRGTIAWHVKKAKSKGKNKAKLLPVENNFAVVSGLQDALAQYTVVVAELAKKKSYVNNDDDLITWNKFRVLEVLSRPAGQQCPDCLPGLNAPSDVGPLSPGEILLPTSGGAVVIDGVEVESEDKDFREHFLPSRKYLMFISLDETRGIGRLSLGPYGVFTIAPDGRVQPTTSVENPLGRELETESNRSLNLLRERLQNRP